MSARSIAIVASAITLAALLTRHHGRARTADGRHHGRRRYPRRRCR